MPKPVGLFDSFDNLDQISPEVIASWVKPVPQINLLENYIANRILYPQTLPLTQYDVQIDLAILKEAIRISNQNSASQKNNVLLGGAPFLNLTLRKILIPRRFLDYLPDLMSLTLVFVDALLLSREKKDFFEDLWTIVLTGDIDEIVGSIILPQFTDSLGIMNLSLLGKNYKIKQGSLNVIPCPKERCEIEYKMQNGKVLGKGESALEVYGGKLGLIVDGRSR